MSFDPADGTRAAELAARNSYGRLVALLAARSGDIASAEDALADAFAAALTHWPQQGVPANPDAWLYTTARRRLLDGWRHAQVQEQAQPTLRLLAEDFAPEEGHTIPDERLKLMFVCAHPAIDAAARTPLMLQAILGLDASRIASAFITSPAALGQRLVRAKAKIRQAGISFEVPGPDELPGRLGDVMDAIYAAYGTGWDDVDGMDARRAGLTHEAIALGQTLCELLPAQAEPRGLLALMLFCEARAQARRSPQGDYVALAAQDPAHWDHALLAQAERQLLQAAALRRIGPYQLEAAIQSAHTQRKLGCKVAPEAVVALYDALLALRPRLGAQVSRACALEAAAGSAAALAALDALERSDVADYQPYWAARAHMLSELGRLAEAQEAYTQALGLTMQPAARRFLQAKLIALQGRSVPPDTSLHPN